MRKYVCAPMIMAVLLVAGCANYAPVPGGGETINAAYFQSDDDFKSRVMQLQPGMGESQVMSILGRNRDEMTALSRDEIVRALYGANSMQTFSSARERDAAHRYLTSLYGYHLEYKNVKSGHGLESPIRLKTTKQGFKYNLDLVFQNGQLVERPVLSGGIVNESSSRTFFDYLNPGALMGRI